MQNSTRIEIKVEQAGVGSLLLWIPEAINSDKGNSAVYPRGTWTMNEGVFEQRVRHQDTVGPGNCPKIDDQTFECGGIHIPADNPVEWTTVLDTSGSTIRFSIELRNLGKTPIYKAGAAVCLKFEDADWWSDETTFVSSGGKLVSLSKLGRDAGQPNGFQAYLIAGQEYNHVFWREYWGFNRHRLDKPFMISQNTDREVCVGIDSERAHFLHSNPGNPCTDIMLNFGDVSPRGVSRASGFVWIRPGLAPELVNTWDNKVMQAMPHGTPDD